MTSTFTRIITITLLALALSARGDRDAARRRQVLPAGRADDARAGRRWQPSPLIFIAPALVVAVVSRSRSYLRSTPPARVETRSSGPARPLGRAGCGLVG